MSGRGGELQPGNEGGAGAGDAGVLLSSSHRRPTGQLGLGKSSDSHSSHGAAPAMQASSM